MIWPILLEIELQAFLRIELSDDGALGFQFVLSGNVKTYKHTNYGTQDEVLWLPKRKLT